MRTPLGDLLERIVTLRNAHEMALKGKDRLIAETLLADLEAIVKAKNELLEVTG